VCPENHGESKNGILVFFFLAGFHIGCRFKREMAKEKVSLS
jgi:hypothetical protein